MSLVRGIFFTVAFVPPMILVVVVTPHLQVSFVEPGAIGGGGLVVLVMV